MSFLDLPPRQFQLEPSWHEVLGAEFEQEYMLRLHAFLRAEIRGGATLYPPGEEIFAAFALTPLPTVKVVILGQDPYHGPGQAHGLAFSVRPGQRIPPSLANIFRELTADLGLPPSRHGSLESWARQGVLLLNTVLTVAAGRPSSHHRQGWERFTSQVIALLNQQRTGLVFLLWGREAQEKCKLIDRNRHLLLQAAHPSPFSAHRGFLGCHHFSQANAYLRHQQQAPIDWRLPSVPF